MFFAIYNNARHHSVVKIYVIIVLTVFSAEERP